LVLRASAFELKIPGSIDTTTANMVIAKSADSTLNDDDLKMRILDSSQT